MMSSIIKYPVCLIKGHKLDTASIIDFIDRGNHLIKCSRCGLYHAQSSLSGIGMTVSERCAMKWKREHDEAMERWRRMVGDSDETD